MVLGSLGVSEAAASEGLQGRFFDILALGCHRLVDEGVEQGSEDRRQFLDVFGTEKLRDHGEALQHHDGVVSIDQGLRRPHRDIQLRLFGFLKEPIIMGLRSEVMFTASYRAAGG